MIFHDCCKSSEHMSNTINLNPANWPAPDWLHAGTIVRTGGVSQSVYASMNLAAHVGDDENHVSQNRELLKKYLSLPTDPVWLKQIHGNQIVNLDQQNVELEADGSLTTKIGTVCAVLTADCVPVLLCDTEQHKVAAIHVGWRGFSQRIIESATQCFAGSQSNTMAWIGPHICSRHYEIDDRVRNACMNTENEIDAAFTPTRTGHWNADLGLMVELSLQSAGISDIYHTKRCTFCDGDSFYSHRRDGTTGRMATLIWMHQ